MKAAGAVYLDTSAAAKLLVWEGESGALRAFLKSRPQRYSSALLRVELARILLRQPGEGIALAPAAEELLQAMVLLGLDAKLLATAGKVRPPDLRSLDAIHLASALTVPGLDGMVVYDRRLAKAAEQRGMRVYAPAADED